MPLLLHLINETPRRAPRRLFRQLLGGAYARRRADAAAVNLLIVGDERITALNAQFLRHNYSTDVIAFPDGDDRRGKKQLGDIVVNAELAAREAAARGWRTEHELALYALHGLLHLLGYDDHAPDDYQAMVNAEREEFAAAGLGCKV